MRLPVLPFIAPFALFLQTVLPAAPVQARVAPKASVQAPPVAPDAVLAPAWILMDPATGRVLESKNAHQRMFPASTTKTMTALLAIESGKLDEVVRIGPNPPKTGEQSILLMQGEQFVLRDLVRAALIKSANDSCVAIAEAVAGDVPTFVKMMNEKAKELGAKNTHFCNPHGLHDANHYTTAYDLALIAQAAMQHPEFNEITRTQQADIHGNWKIGPSRPLVNRNRLLFRWAQCDGVKTGYTRQAGRCLIASATQIDATTKEPWRLLSVVLHAPDSWHDAQALLQYHGFAQFKPLMVARSGEEIGETAVQNGGHVTAVLPQTAILTLRDDEKSALTREVKWDELSAPLQAGQVVGHLDYFANGQKVAALPLVAQNAVSVSRLAAVMPAGLNAASNFKNYFSLPQWPTPNSLMAPGLVLFGLTLLWGGLRGTGKSGRKQSYEKRQSPARRAAPNQTPNRPNQNNSNRRTNSNAADDNQQNASQRTTQQRPSQPRTAQQRTAQQRTATHSRAARQAQQFRHSAPGSIQKERQRNRTVSGAASDKKADERCLGEQFIARFLTEESNADITNNLAPQSEFKFIGRETARTSTKARRWDES